MTIAGFELRFLNMRVLCYNDTMTNAIELKDLESMQCQDSIRSVGEVRGAQGLYIIEPKYDGFRLVAHVKEDSVDFYTREMKLQNGKLPYVESQLLQLFPAGTVIDGEITAHYQREDGVYEMDFEHVQSVMLSLPERSVQVAKEVRPLNYYMFDMMFLGGHDLRSEYLRDRKEKLKIMCAAIGKQDNVFLGPFVEAKQEYHDEWYNAGFEGSVAKLLTSTYQSGSRSKGWFKIKPHKEVDVIVTGYTEGDKEGKYADTIGSITFGQPDENGDIVERGQCSGMTEDVRYEVGN
ncbi:hypothetical protein EBZ39_16260, partial [bacterium]|nr:hypothetical protein [bacterium]